MPYAHTRKKIPRSLDRRVKISDDQKIIVKDMHKNGISQRTIARNTGISRRSVQFILFPHMYEVALQQFKERRKDGRYKPTTKERTRTQREHRQYKQSIKEFLTEPTNKN